MINPTELRIGNYATILSGEQRTITGIQKCSNDQYQIEFGNNGLYISHLNAIPIALTTQWLERFGLIEDKDDEDFDEGVIHYEGLGISAWADNESIKEHGWTVDIEFKGQNPSCDDAIIKYVHQLQNLYTTLTGKELTTKDNA